MNGFHHRFSGANFALVLGCGQFWRFVTMDTVGGPNLAPPHFGLTFPEGIPELSKKSNAIYDDLTKLALNWQAEFETGDGVRRNRALWLMTPPCSCPEEEKYL